MTTSGLPVPLPVGRYALGSYPDYAQAQAVVDHLSDAGFPVETVSIVGADLRLVERVTGRVTRGRAALAGALSTGWLRRGTRCSWRTTARRRPSGCSPSAEPLSKALVLARGRPGRDALGHPP